MSGVDDPQRVRRGNPNFARHNQQAPDGEVARWYDAALGVDEPRPDGHAREKLAREIQIVVNRVNNAQLERSSESVPIAALRDVSPADVLDRKLAAVKTAADQLLAVLDNLANFTGGYVWDGSPPTTLDEAQGFVAALARHPDGYRVPLQPNPPKNPKGGRPVVGWHEAGRQIAAPIARTLQQAGYHGRMKATDENSPVAIIGAMAINWAYGIEIEARGFAQAMLRRNRSKTKDADEVLRLITNGAKH
ncbi:MAG TPA: hypothetical protein VG328_07400 [Stellaceae bacterium]|jgi:hypothetical protein|nr:hypothetical protein [Stellaceae bacterium]